MKISSKSASGIWLSIKKDGNTGLFRIHKVPDILNNGMYGKKEKDALAQLQDDVSHMIKEVNASLADGYGRIHSEPEKPDQSAKLAAPALFAKSKSFHRPRRILFLKAGFRGIAT